MGSDCLGKLFLLNKLARTSLNTLKFDWYLGLFYGYANMVCHILHSIWRDFWSFQPSWGGNFFVFSFVNTIQTCFWFLRLKPYIGQSFLSYFISICVCRYVHLECCGPGLDLFHLRSVVNWHHYLQAIQGESIWYLSYI